MTSQELLKIMSRETELAKIVQRKLQFLGHVMRDSKYEVLQLILQCKIHDRRSVRQEEHFGRKNGLQIQIRLTYYKNPRRHYSHIIVLYLLLILL